MAGNISLPSVDNLEYQDFLENDLAVTVYLAILSVIGTFGNIHSVFVYALRYKPSNHKTFVVWLSVVDLIACCMSIPFELFDIRYNYTFTSVEGCKFFRFLNHFVSICSGTLLGVIAIERFRKACRPLGRQVTKKEALIACISTVVISIAISSPAFALYGVAEEEIDNQPLNGTDCTVATLYKGTRPFRIYNYFLLLLSTGVFIVCVIMYIFIGRALFAHMKFVASSQVLSKRLTKKDSKASQKIESVDKLTSLQAKNSKENSSNGGEPTKQSNNSGKYFGCGRTRKRFDRSKQITFMFLVATAVSYVGYLPYIFLTILKAANTDFYDDVKYGLGSFNGVFLRGYFISNVTNPIVYCFLDDRFRHECQEAYISVGKFLCRRRSEKHNVITKNRQHSTKVDTHVISS